MYIHAPSQEELTAALVRANTRAFCGNNGGIFLFHSPHHEAWFFKKIFPRDTNKFFTHTHIQQERDQLVPDDDDNLNQDHSLNSGLKYLNSEKGSSTHTENILWALLLLPWKKSALFSSMWPPPLLDTSLWPFSCFLKKNVLVFFYVVSCEPLFWILFHIYHTQCFPFLALLSI